MAAFFQNLSIFEWIYDGVIVLWALVIFCALSSVSRSLKEIVEKTDRAYSSAKSETRIDASGNTVEGTSRTFNREKHEPIRAEFTKLAVRYIKWSNLIPTLTLLGLLGTVLGLMPGLAAVKEQDFGILYSSLSTSLTSTALGLISSLILKIYASAKPDARVNEVEIQFEEIDRRYDIALGADRISRS